MVPALPVVPAVPPVPSSPAPQPAAAMHPAATTNAKSRVQFFINIEGPPVMTGSVGPLPVQ
jgi:hypothetical protein